MVELVVGVEVGELSFVKGHWQNVGDAQPVVVVGAGATTAFHDVVKLISCRSVLVGPGTYF